MNLEMIHKIAKATGIEAGEMVLVHFWGEDIDKRIANSFMIAVAAQVPTPCLVDGTWQKCILIL